MLLWCALFAGALLQLFPLCFLDHHVTLRTFFPLQQKATDLIIHLCKYSQISLVRLFWCLNWWSLTRPDFSPRPIVAVGSGRELQNACQGEAGKKSQTAKLKQLFLCFSSVSQRKKHIITALAWSSKAVVDRKIILARTFADGPLHESSAMCNQLAYSYRIKYFPQHLHQIWGSLLFFTVLSCHL